MSIMMNEHRNHERDSQREEKEKGKEEVLRRRRRRGEGGEGEGGGACRRSHTQRRRGKTSRSVHGAGGGPRQAEVMVSGSCMVWQGSGVSPAAGGENFWAFFFPSKHTFSPQNMLYMRVYR
jgi:hypothetical protein